MKIVVLVVLSLVLLIESEGNAVTARTSRIRFLNSMPQFGKSKLLAENPQQTVFDSVPPGYMTSYNDVAAKSWSFTAKFSANVTAKSDVTDLDDDSYATVFTCQTNQKKLKNKLIYDQPRSGNAKTAIIRTVNLGQFDYPVDVFNRSNNQQLFNSVNYCQASTYRTVPPGDYTFDWVVSDSKKRGVQQIFNSTSTPIFPGFAYTFWITASGTLLTRDAKKKTTRDIQVGQIRAARAAQKRNLRQVAERNQE